MIFICFILLQTGCASLIDRVNSSVHKFDSQAQVESVLGMPDFTHRQPQSPTVLYSEYSKNCEVCGFVFKDNQLTAAGCKVEKECDSSPEVGPALGVLVTGMSGMTHALKFCQLLGE